MATGEQHLKHNNKTNVEIFLVAFANKNEQKPHTSSHLRAASGGVRTVGGALHCEVGKTAAELTLVWPPSVAHCVGLTVILTLLTGGCLTPAHTHTHTRRQWDCNADTKTNRHFLLKKPSRDVGGWTSWFNHVFNHKAWADRKYFLTAGEKCLAHGWIPIYR